jgi:hypothetical protein
MQPFGELTNRSPSPAQPEGDDGRAARKHSPWTAARQKKKTRSVHSSLLAEEADVAVQDCFGSPGTSLKSGTTQLAWHYHTCAHIMWLPRVPVLLLNSYAQDIAVTVHAVVPPNSGGCSSDIDAEYSLADGLSPTEQRSSPADSPHSSPPLDRDQDAEVHPAKAYIVDQQVTRWGFGNLVWLSPGTAA